jgi:hypothetical protein
MQNADMINCARRTKHITSREFLLKYLHKSQVTFFSQALPHVLLEATVDAVVVDHHNHYRQFVPAGTRIQRKYVISFSWHSSY